MAKAKRRRDAQIRPVDVGKPRVRAGQAAGPDGRTDWYRIENQAGEGGEAAEVWIYDEIGYWGTTAARLVRELRDITADAIDLRLNSPGGDVYDGIAIMNALIAHDADVTVYVDGLAASAASFIAQAGDRVVIRQHAEMMVHLPWGLTVGDAADHQAMANDLERIGRNIASIYAARAGGTVDEWYEVMEAETWYSAEEAVDAGLADEMLPAGKGASSGSSAGGDGNGDGDGEGETSPEDSFDLSRFRYAGRQNAPRPQPPAAPRVGAARERDRLASIAAIHRGEDPPSQRPITSDRRNLPPEVLGRLAERGVNLGVVDRVGRLVEGVWFTPAVRALDDGSAGIYGYASVYDTPYDVAGGPDSGGWTETIVAGAGDKSLAQGADVRFLLNHDGPALARRSPRHNTMTVESDHRGIFFDVPEFDLGSPSAQTVVSALRRGDMDEMSFVFRALRQEWRNNFTDRRILELAIYDTSLVNFGANAAASGQVHDQPKRPGAYPLSLALAEVEQLALDRR